MHSGFAEQSVAAPSYQAPLADDQIVTTAIAAKVLDPLSDFGEVLPKPLDSSQLAGGERSDGKENGNAER